MNNYQLRVSYGKEPEIGNHVAYYPSKGKALTSAYGRCRGIRNDGSALTIKFTIWNVKNGKCVGGYEVAQTDMGRLCEEIKVSRLPKELLSVTKPIPEPQPSMLDHFGIVLPSN